MAKNNQQHNSNNSNQSQPKPYYQTDNGVLYHGDCLDVMPGLDSVDMVLTSPPYDDLRTYENNLIWNEEIWKRIIAQLYQVTKKGGVVVWVVGDATKNGSETGTSFKQALYFKECGFNLHDTMIYQKTGIQFPETNRYYQIFEYMFIFSKGKPKNFNPIRDRENVTCGDTVHGMERQKDGSFKKNRQFYGNITRKYGVRFNIWQMSNTHRGIKHPAIFPEKLAHDHIISWSNENDTVLDIFGGSGTTAIAAENTGRKWICIEKEEKYCEIAAKRIDKETRQLKLFKG